MDSGSIAYLEQSAADLFLLPFNAETLSDAMGVLHSDAAQRIFADLNAEGICYFGSFYTGLRYIWSSEPVATKEDLSEIDLSLCIAPLPAYQNVYDHVVKSASFATLDDVLVSLKVGQDCAYDLSTSEIIETELYRYTPYCLKLGHTFSSTSVLMSEAAQKRLSAEQLCDLEECMNAAVTYAQVLYGSLNTAWERDFEKIGIHFFELSEPELAEVRSITQAQFRDFRINTATAESSIR